jgi:hypothetical protein
MPVRVFSGIAPPQALLDAMAAASLQPSSSSKLKPQPSVPTEIGSSRPPMPPRPTGEPVPVNSGDVYDDAPPSYEDAMGDHLSPLDGPRREYHPPDASSPSTVEFGADSKSAAQPGKALEDGPAAEGSSAPRRRGNRASTESFDMLPTTPPESQSGSPPASPVRRPGSMMKFPRNNVDEESPPQYEPVAGNQLNVPQAVQRQRSRNNLRPMNLGVPNRKPVPRNPNQAQ